MKAMKAKALSLALLAACLAGPASPLIAAEAAAPVVRAAAINTPDPAQQIKDMARLFRAGDVAGMVRAAVPPSHWDMARGAWEVKRMEPTTAHDREEFAEHIGKLTAADAVDTIMAEIEPKLAEARAQAPGALLMAFGAAQMAINSPDSELTIDQRAALQSALPGFQQWASTTDFLDAGTLRDALTLLSAAARRSGISSLDQLKALPLEAALDRAGPLLAAAKDAVQLYGLDLDAVADSLQVDVLENDGQKARVRTTVTLFGAPVWHEHELLLVEGRWFGKKAMIHFNDRHRRHDHSDGQRDEDEGRHDEHEVDG